MATYLIRRLVQMFAVLFLSSSEPRCRRSGSRCC